MVTAIDKCILKKIAMVVTAMDINVTTRNLKKITMVVTAMDINVTLNNIKKIQNY